MSNTNEKARILDDLATMRILNRAPIAKDESPWLTAYMTKGRTYIIATSGIQDDNRKPNDLIAVTRFGQVVSLAGNVSPELLAEVEGLFA